MKKFLQSEILYGLILTALTTFLYLGHSSFLETIELKFYDFRARLRIPDNPSKAVAIIAIDEESIEKIGRWPWPRSKVAKLLEILAAPDAKPKTIGFDIIFSEAEQNQGLGELVRLKETMANSLTAKEEVLAKQKPRFAKADWGVRQSLKWWEQALEDDKKILDAIKDSYVSLDNDAKFETSLATAGNVILPLFFEMGGSMEGKPSELPESISKSAILVQASAGQQAGGILASTRARFPIDRFAQKSSGVGHVNDIPDLDGTIRREPLAIAYGSNIYPSFALAMVRHYLGLASEDIAVVPGQAVVLGNSPIPLDERGFFTMTFSPTYRSGTQERSFSQYSFYDVIEGKVAPQAFKDKMVIIGPTAAGLGSTYVTTVSPNSQAVEVVANAVDNLLNKRFLVRPTWSFAFELVSIIILGLFISLALPKLKAKWGAVTALILLTAYLASGVYLFSANGWWLKVMYPSFLLAAGYTLIMSKRFLITEKKKEQVEGESIETNKMLGLSFQGQGMLDLAFEKFRKCPIDDNIKDLMYNLGLDFERKRQFNKAVAVYEYVHSHDAKFKDVAQKIGTMKKAAEGAIMGGPIGKGREATMIVEGASIKPTLGRYEIEKELGKGAMGIVYLGRDPKINRLVAIKTMRFEEGTDEATIKSVKERFFREAESAGNLSHPNIIKIFDAGEEQDMSYIAMELLDGEDLKNYTGKSKLLPIPKVVQYITTVAESLDYAHKQGVVHRDIKPANIMLLKDGTLRVTDFGIARITASSQTATGTVLGTPSYMSPEQISGKKVDGRSDLFSLGVMLFEMLTGEKPWKGGDSIGTLLFQIANDPPPDPLMIRPDLPKPLAMIIDRMLKKNADERYQTGADVAADLKAAMSGAGISPPTPPKPPAEVHKVTPEPPKPTAPVKPAEPKPPIAVAPASIQTTETRPAAAGPALKPATAPAPVPVSPSPAAIPAPAPSSITNSIKPPAPSQKDSTKPAERTLPGVKIPPTEKTQPMALKPALAVDSRDEKTLVLNPAPKSAPAPAPAPPAGSTPSAPAKPVEPLTIGTKEDDKTLVLPPIPAKIGEPPSAPKFRVEEKKSSRIDEIEKTLPIIGPPP